MRLGGAAEIRVVTRSEKADVIARCEQLGVEVVPAQPATLGESLATGAEGIDGGAIALIGFPDSIWQPADGYRQLIEQLGAGFEISLGLFRTTGVEPPHIAELVPGADAVTAVEARPAEPPPHLIWGIAAVRAPELGALASGRHPTEAFDARARDGAVGGVHLSDDYIDIGTPAGLERGRRAAG